MADGRAAQLLRDALALQGGQLLRVVETRGDGGRRVEYHGRRDHWPGQRPAPHLVQARHAHETARARLLLEQRVDERLPLPQSHS